ncbi:MAG: bifunctional demethylmenaquinone methyltransferase/2-methoxy-6-polyprenyl-1,4-benzoquinol methylase UbiE [Lutibacter sp.]|jgi:demethylmenaquinone methyltransferase/2-methoxy-6-polyprenyl-1,4-benzoquinol methylase|nr:bifunctional demethylmenaquinone methyltransferase/2-methoxy-6-polyprenyl-1,4-benzoquinol methylase UbiE [Lutibacter sp.]
MEEPIRPYKNEPLGKKAQVTTMFNTISKEYDGLNRVISFGIDVKWRKKVVQIVADSKPETVLDIATGTGDLAIALAKTCAAKITGLDIAEGMLEIGRKKLSEQSIDSVEMLVGDAENIPFEEATFEAVTVAFGVRNFENLEKGLSEIYRVLKPGGVLVVLETAVPRKTPFKQGYYLYNRFVLPTIGKLFSKDRSAYRYLSESAAAFPHGKAFNNILQKTGFDAVEDHPQTFGVASIYLCKK